MSRAEIRVELALTTNPTEAPTWIDVSAYALEVHTRRGRQHELDRVEAGSATVVLDNRDRRFDPTNTSGPYFGNLLPMRRIRVSALWNGFTYPIFTGFIEAWPQSWKDFARGEVPVDAVDGLKALSLKQLNTSYAQENTGTRIHNVLNDASWTVGAAWVLGSSTNSQLGSTTVVGPVGDRSIDAGKSTVQAATLENTPALQHIEDVLAVENGIYFIAKDGSFVWRNRHSRLQDPSSRATFGDGAGELPYADLLPSYDDARIWNEIRVKRLGSETLHTVNDATSQQRYFPRTLSRESLLLAHIDGETAAEAEALSLANYLLRTYKEPALRFTEMLVQPEMDDALWPVVLGLEIDDRIMAKRRFPGGGNALSQACFVEGIEHTITQSRWDIRFRLSPADTNTYWKLGDAVASVLGSTTVLAY